MPADRQRSASVRHPLLMPRFAWLVILVAVLSCRVLPSPVAANEPLKQAIHEVVQQPHFKHAHWGALFVDRESGDVVFEHAIHKLFVPASTTKLFTVACALDALGADHRFQTPVVRHGDVDEHGELSGDLIVTTANR